MRVSVTAGELKFVLVLVQFSNCCRERINEGTMSTEESQDLVESLTLDTEPPGDHDTEEDVGSVFSAQYQETASVCLSLTSCSVVGLEELGESGLVAGLSHTGLLTCHDLETLSLSARLGSGEDPVRAVRSHATDHNLLLTCGSTVKVWDVRDPREAVMVMKTSESPASFSCLASSRAGLLVAGTDQQALDAFLLFWDLKAGSELLGGYWSVHSGSITLSQ